MRRKLAVILASDIAGYSRLVALDEETAIARFAKIKGAVSELIEAHHGRVFNTAGDAILAEFESATEAVRCAIEIQESNRTRNVAFPESQAMLLRIGIALGDVLVQPDDGDLLGDGVNIAARLEALAMPGGICISEDIYNHVHRNLSCEVVDLGPQELKNIGRPIKAYGIDPPGSNRASRPRWSMSRLVLLGSVVVMLGLGGWAWLAIKKPGAGRNAPPVAVTPPAPSTSTQDMASAPAQQPGNDKTPPPQQAMTDAPQPPAPPSLEARLEAELGKFNLPDHKAGLSKTIQDYATREAYKALAVSPGGGVWTTQRAVSGKDAANLALESCQLAFGKPCLLIARGEEILPETEELRHAPQFMPRVIYAGPYDAAKIPILGPAARVRLDVRDYTDIATPKAMAISPSGRVAVATAATPDEAEIKALSQCGNSVNAGDAPCRTYAIDNTVVLPQRRALVR